MAVHCVNGVWGTLAAGLFACNERYGSQGLFYGGGLRQLGVQTLGVLCVGGYTVLCMIPVFKLIAGTIGLRAGAMDGQAVVSTGLAGLDRALDSLRAGETVVWQIENSCRRKKSPLTLSR